MTSKTARAPNGGGIDSCLRADTTPVAASAIKKGIEVIKNAFATAILSLPPFNGLFFEDQ